MVEHYTDELVEESVFREIEEKRLSRLAFEIKRREEKRKKVGKLIRETFDKKTREAMDEMGIHIVSFIGESIHQVRTYETSLWYYFLCIGCKRRVYVKRMAFTGVVLAVCHSCAKSWQSESVEPVSQETPADLNQNLTR